MNKAIRRLSLILLAISSVSANGAGSKEIPGINQIPKRLYGAGMIPNYVIMVSQNGETIFSEAAGYVDITAVREVDENSIYAIASMTKPIVSTAVLQLIERGQLGLETKLKDIFPQFAFMMVAPGGDMSAAFEPAKTDITIRHLLTHTAGFTYPPAVLGVGDVAELYDELGMMALPTLDEFIETISQVPLVAHPGESFNYSMGVDILGAVIEKVSGQKLSQFIRENITGPLEMKDTDFWVPEEKRNRLVHVYAPEDINNAAPSSLSGQPSWKISETPYFGIPFEYLGRPGRMESGGGGLFSSASDYLRYASAIALGGELGGVRILSAETVKLHFTNLMPDLGLEAFEAAFGPSAQFMQFAGGFGIKLEADGSGASDYAFWGGAANTFFWIDREKQIAGLFFSHISPPRYNVIEDIEQAVDLAFERK